MRSFRIAITVGLVTALSALPAESAQAAPPTNDDASGAITLTIGETVTQDTTEATTDEQDAALNANCEAPFTNASVWYTFTAASDDPVLLDMTRSDYTGGFLVFEGAPTVDSLVTCGADDVAVYQTSGTTYNVMVISDTEVNGGNLVLSLSNPPPPPRLRLHIAPQGQYHHGAARIHGRYRCRGADYSSVSASMVQRFKRLKISSYDWTELQCDGKVRQWRLRMVSDVGRYGKGHARVRVNADACGYFDCVGMATARRIRLVKGTFKPPSASASTTATRKFEPTVSSGKRWGTG